MEKEFVPYTEALELKELGFDEPCFGKFDGRGKNKGKIWYEMPNTGQDSIPVGDVLAPTYSQCFRFFREKHGLFIQPNRTIDSEGTWYYFSIASKRTDVCEGSFVYEEAELACLKKLIQIVKNK